ncbi:MAG: radical SAM family heme chaperone HemW [Ferruginibacter sp.]|nr:radical SAM family heme chaperone HemW [Ferruginibacter sp.]
MAGIYIHIPFCRKACHYCNFHFSTSFSQRDRVLNAIRKEIETTPPNFNIHETIDTIYFGGGTPSLLTEAELLMLMDALKRFKIKTDAEITLEANPDDIQPHQLEPWLRAGINRLSVGIQSFDESELKWMNRSHTAAQSLNALKEITAAGFTNYSADLIYGSPLSSHASLKHHLAVLLDAGVPHLSCYALTVEPQTVLDYKIQAAQNSAPDPEVQWEHFNMIREVLGHAGYEHYEISNFALPGMRSVHNSSYWKGAPYMGYGPSAHSYNGIDVRNWNVSNNIEYTKLMEAGLPAGSGETLTHNQRMNERIMISLRTMEGIDLIAFEQAFGAAATDLLIQRSVIYCTRGELVHDQNTLRLSDSGKFLADGIAAGLFV